MPDTMKVHLYQVAAGQNSPNITTVLTAVQAMPLAERYRVLGRNEIRLESAVPPGGDNRTNYWLLDFTRLRFQHGPGKASRTDPVQGFDLEDDEGFGEETAALYDPRTGYMLVQYNHFGVRAGTIRDYLSFIVPGRNNQILEYEFRAKLDESAEARLAQKQILTKIQFKIAPANITAAQRAANVGLTQALELNDAVNGQFVEVTLSAGKQKNAMLSSRQAQRIIRNLRNLVGAGDDIVERFEVTGKSAPDERSEAIDMLSPKLELEMDGIEMGPDLRYTQESRWNALLRARNGWQGVI